MEAFDFIINIQLIQALVLIAGLILVIIEMFHPGFGAPGIAGGILLVIGVFLTAKTFVEGLILVLIILAILSVALTLVIRSVKKGRLSKKLVLRHYQDKESGYIGTDDLKFFIDKEGETVTILRPSGTANFDGVRLDVVSEGGFIPVGTPVRIIKVEGPRIVVREIKS